MTKEDRQELIPYPAEVEKKIDHAIIGREAAFRERVCEWARGILGITERAPIDDDDEAMRLLEEIADAFIMTRKGNPPSSPDAVRILVNGTPYEAVTTITYSEIVGMSNHRLSSLPSVVYGVYGDDGTLLLHGELKLGENVGVTDEMSFEVSMRDDRVISEKKENKV